MAEMIIEKPLRCFLAIPIKNAPKHAIKELQHQLELDLTKQIAPQHFRWVKPQNLHTTLFFLGNQQLSVMEKLIATLENNHNLPPAFSIHLDQLAMFPPKHPHIIALLGDSNRLLIMLANQLRNTLLQLNIAFDDKKLLPHVTIAHCDKTIDLKPNNVNIPLLADSFVLYQSTPGQTGSVYTELHEFKL